MALSKAISGLRKNFKTLFMGINTFYYIRSAIINKMNENNTHELEEFEYYAEQKVIEQNILLKIWSSPGKVFKFINDNEYDKYKWLLFILGGIANGLDRSIQKSSGDTQSLGEILIYSIFGGALFGWISFYIFAGILSLTGKIFKGEGNTSSIARMLSYAYIPTIVAMFVMIPQIVISGTEVFKTDGVIYGEGLVGTILTLATGVIELTLACWTIFLCVVGLAEVQKFPVWKAAINVVIPLAIIVGLILSILL
jgi:hypothetical protein